MTEGSTQVPHIVIQRNAVPTNYQQEGDSHYEVIPAHTEDKQKDKQKDQQEEESHFEVINVISRDKQIEEGDYVMVVRPQHKKNSQQKREGNDVVSTPLKGRKEIKEGKNRVTSVSTPLLKRKEEGSYGMLRTNSCRSSLKEEEGEKHSNIAISYRRKGEEVVEEEDSSGAISTPSYRSLEF